MIEELLRQIGFNETESSLYLAVLRHGKVTPTEVAKITGINRTTIYSSAKELVKKGAITEDLSGASLHLIALPPEDLRDVIKQRELQVIKEKDVVEDLIVELGEFTKQAKYSIPKIRFIFEDEVESFLYKQTEKWNKSMNEYDKTWWGIQDHTLVEHYEKWIDWYWKEVAKDNEHLKLLSNRSDIEKEMKKKKYERREIKFWKNLKDISATTWILGDYIVMIATRKKPFYLVELHDSVMASNMREMYKGVWKSLI